MRSELYNQKAQRAIDRLKTDLSWIKEMAGKLRLEGMIQGIHDFLPLKMVEIQNYLEKIKPEFIIELGCGFSTKVFHDYCEKTEAQMISYEESIDWADTVSFLAGQEEIEIAEVEKIEKGVFYKDIFWNIFKNRENILIYVDAPSNTINGRVYPCLDVVRMFNQGFFPDTILFDIRANTVMKVLEMTNEYNTSLGYLMNGIEADKHHTIMTRGY